MLVRSTLSTRTRGAAFVSGVVALVLAVAACGERRRRAEATFSSTVGPATPVACATPTEGCPCDEPGKAVDCGRVKYQSGDFVACEMGRRTCAAAKWSTCVAENTGLGPKTYTAQGPIHGLALGNAAACPTSGPLSNPCDPYCNYFVDDAAGVEAGPGSGITLADDAGITFGEAGVTITSGAGGGGGAEAPYVGTKGGFSRCAPNGNIGIDTAGIGAACDPALSAQYSTCQQDTRCDPVVQKCMWNGGPGYYDPAAGGVDLTVGTPCGESGSTFATVPVCNRGSLSVPAGLNIRLWKSTGVPPNGCGPTVGTLIGDFVLASAMAPGQCVTWSVPNTTAAGIISVNLGGAAAPIIEGPNRCRNNSAYWNTEGAAGCATCQSCTTTITGKVYDPSGYTPAPTGVTPPDSLPASGANNTPLPGISVFQPSAPLTAINAADVKTCDSCASLSTPSLYRTTTDPTGAFTMPVLPSAHVPIVVQTGRWRRMVTVNVPACTTTDFELATRRGSFRLPRHVADGYGGIASIPRIAITTGSEESLECLLVKLGVRPDQFARYSDAATQRILLFRDNGTTTTSGATYVDAPTPTPPSPDPGIFWSRMDRFNAILTACGTSSQKLFTQFDDSNTASVDYVGSTRNVVRRNALRDYANGGGRYFSNHRAGGMLLRHPTDPTWGVTPPAPGGVGIVKWIDSTAVGTYEKAVVPLGQPAPSDAALGQARFSQWLTAVGANGTFGPSFIRVDFPAKGVKWVGNGAIEWLRANPLLPTTGCSSGSVSDNTCQNKWDGVSGAAGANDGNEYGRRVLSFSYKTGTTGANTTCGPDASGIVLFNSMHVAPSRTSSSTGSFDPANLATAGVCVNGNLTPEEKALEHQIFQLTACNPSGLPPIDPPPPPPPTPPNLTPQTFSRDYLATCPTGDRARWSFFYWQANVPVGASIAFRAATASELAALPPTTNPPPFAPATADIGLAATSVLPPSWDVKKDASLNPIAVETLLGMPSQRYLRVYVSLSPNADNSPTLISWRQTYDCVPAE